MSFTLTFFFFSFEPRLLSSYFILFFIARSSVSLVFVFCFLLYQGMVFNNSVAYFFPVDSFTPPLFLEQYIFPTEKFPDVPVLSFFFYSCQWFDPCLLSTHFFRFFFMGLSLFFFFLLLFSPGTAFFF